MPLFYPYMLAKMPYYEKREIVMRLVKKKKKKKLELNKIYCCDNVKFMRNKIPSNFIDITVTSPPYDNLRNYNGYCWDFEGVAKELYRVTKDGGVVVWIVGDATIREVRLSPHLNRHYILKD